MCSAYKVAASLRQFGKSGGFIKSSEKTKNDLFKALKQGVGDSLLKHVHPRSHHQKEDIMKEFGECHLKKIIEIYL